MRVRLAELQRRYKEKQRELARLQRRHDHEYGPPGAGWGALPRGGSHRGCQARREAVVWDGPRGSRRAERVSGQAEQLPPV